MVMANLRNFLAELKRRRVIQVAVVYAVAGFAVIEAADVILPRLQIPDWTVTLVVVLIVLGFPIALVLAWAYDITPEGVQRTEPLSPGGEAADGEEPAAAAVSEPPEGRRSIAVLPFVDMSPEHDQEYFSDGISEELINALTKLEGLRVAARTSAFAFKGANQSIQTIGEKLKVETVLEGSVRKAGNRLRITAQLVNVSDGYHLWSEQYDRELDDVFAVQSDISRNIVDVLKVKLVGEEGPPAITLPSGDPRAYELYLKGRYQWNKRTGAGLKKAIEYFERAIEGDPNNAPAYAGLADSYAILGIYGAIPPNVAMPKAREAALKALEIDANLGGRRSGFRAGDRDQPRLSHLASVVCRQLPDAAGEIR
jgi:adenylate cyclase